MDPDYLVFARIVENGSLSAAARTMLASPAMVSKRLARLEARLGVRLLHRTTRQMTLTEVGKRFYNDLSSILQELREVEQRIVSEQGEPAGVLRISAPTSFGRLHVAPMLHEFLVRHPKVELELELSDGYVDLFTAGFDLAIRIASSAPVSLEVHRLGGSRRILCASPAYLARHGAPATIAELSKHRLLAADGQLPWRLVNGRRHCSVAGQSCVRTNSSEVVRELAVTGVGIALRSLWDVGPLVADGTLVPVLAGWEGPTNLAIYAVHPRTPIVPPAVNAMVLFLMERSRGAPWGD